MKKQLVTSVEVAYVSHIYNLELMAIGEVFYMRRTRILKRLVRKVIHKVEVPVDYFISVDKAKAEARRRLDDYVHRYYSFTHLNW